MAPLFCMVLKKCMELKPSIFFSFWLKIFEDHENNQIGE